jgi:hypothetical protein
LIVPQTIVPVPEKEMQLRFFHCSISRGFTT